MNNYGFSVIIYFVNDDSIQIDFVHEIYEAHDMICFELKETDIRRYYRNYINHIEIRNI